MPDVVRNPALDPPLVAALVDMWTAVTNAGGAVGLVAPVTPADVRPIAEAGFARVAAGADDLVVAFEEGAPVGFGFLAPGAGLTAHLGVVRRLQRDPRRRGAGVGAAVLAGIEAAGRDRGLALLTLTVRGGTGREAFYVAHGYRVDGRLPARLRLGEGRLVDELHLSKPLQASPLQASADVQDPGVTAAGGVTLRVRRLDPGLPVPAYAHPGDAGLDLRAAADVLLGPGERAVVGTGVAVEVPPGHVGLVHPRSGLAARHGLGIVNAPGTVDAGYRGEVKVVLVNHDPVRPIALARGDRVAQLVVQRVAAVRVEEVDELGPSVRGEGGFGSTGR